MPISATILITCLLCIYHRVSAEPLGAIATHSRPDGLAPSKRLQTVWAVYNRFDRSKPVIAKNN